MDPSFIQNFREYIELSTSDLQTTLTAILMHETLQYDVIYEKFLKVIESYKISMLSQMKLQLFPGNLVTERQKEHIMLQQMKNLVTIKIKTAVEELNLQTEIAARQKLLEHISLLNESLQKIEANLASFEQENIRKGSLTSRTDFSMMFHGFQHNDEARGMIEAAQITPIAQRFSNNKFDNSTVSKFGLTENNVKGFDAQNTDRDLQSQAHTHARLPAFEAQTDSNNVPKLNLDGLNEKKEEQPAESEKLSMPIPSQTQGKSLMDMFDACLNNITNNNGEKHKRALLSQGVDQNRKQKQAVEQYSSSTRDEPSETTAPEVPEKQSVSKEVQEPIRKPVKEMKKKNLSPPGKKFLRYEEEESRGQVFLDKLQKTINLLAKRKYFSQWKLIPTQFRPEKYDDEFDLLHGNIEGIEGMEGFDTDRLVEDPVLKRVLTPIDNQEDIASEYERHNILSGKVSFYDNSFTEPDLPPQAEKMSIQQQTAVEKESEAKPKPWMKKGSMTEASPSKVGAKTLKKPLISKSPLKQSQDKDKLKENIKSNIMKSPRVGGLKKEPEKAEKLKLDSKSSSNKGVNKIPTPAPKNPAAKAGLPPSNKENNFANKASPTNQARKSLTGK